MSLRVDDVRSVAHLARLDLPEAEVQLLAGQMSKIIDYVTLLQQVDTEGVDPLAHPHDTHDVFRADEPRPSLPVDDALANAPARKGDFYSVPAVLD